MRDQHRAPDKQSGQEEEISRSAADKRLALALEEILEQEATAASEAAWLRTTSVQLRQLARSQVPPGLAEQGLAQLTQRIAAERSAGAASGLAAPPAPAHGWLARIRATAAAVFGGRAPLLMASMATVLLVQAAVIAVLLSRPASLESLGAAGRSGADSVLLTVEFQPEARETAIGAVLTQAHAQMVDGPSALGLYTVAVPRAGTDASIAALRGVPGVVRSVQR